MKKLLNIILITLIGLLGVFQISAAARLQNPIQYNTLEDLFVAVIAFIFNVSLLVAPIMIIIGGFYIITATGKPEQIEKGKKIIFGALIGFTIIFISRGLVEVIKGMIKVNP